MKIRISATIDKETKKIIDEKLKEGNYRNKSHVIEEAIKQTIQETGCKGKDFYWPLRAALIGDCSGPEIEKIGAALGKGKFYERIRKYAD